LFEKKKINEKRKTHEEECRGCSRQRLADALNVDLGGALLHLSVLRMQASCVGGAELHQQSSSKSAKLLEISKAADFEVEDDDVDIENELWVTSVANGGVVLDEEDAVSALLSLAGWVNVVEEDVDWECTQSAWP